MLNTIMSPGSMWHKQSTKIPNISYYDVVVFSFFKWHIYLNEEYEGDDDDDEDDIISLVVIHLKQKNFLRFYRWRQNRRQRFWMFI